MSVKSSVGIIGCLLVGAASTAEAQAQYPQFVAAMGVRMPESPIDRAYKQFLLAGVPMVLHPTHPGDYIQFPFGYGEAKVACARLHACPLELEAGERLLDEPLVGDAERWIVETSAAGRNGEMPLVIIKPTDCNLSTNMLIPTDRRVYMLSLVSEPCVKRGLEAAPAVIQRTRFWYPDDMQVTERERERERERVAVTTPCEAEGNLNDAYQLKQRGGSFLRRKRPYEWTPEKVCDDSVRTYIQLPARARHGEMPVLYQIGDDGEKEMLNYTLQGDVIVTDRVLLRGALVVNTGGKERRIDIENRTRPRRDQGGIDVKR